MAILTKFCNFLRNFNSNKKGFYPVTLVRKLLIRAIRELAFRLEEKLRHNYEVRVHILDDGQLVLSVKYRPKYGENG
jgi:hypothetical protein